MAAEYVLVPKHKYEQYQKDALPSTDRQHTSTTESDSSTSTSTHHIPAESVLRGSDDSDVASKSTDMDNREQKQEHGQTGNLFMDVGGVDSDGAGGDDGGKYLSPNDYDVDDVLSSFSSAELKYVHPILTAMENNTNVLSWNKQTGEIELQGRLISDSNVIELLKDTLTATLHPAGKMEFYRGLDMLKVKLKCIKHSKNKKLLTLMREDKIMPQKRSHPVKRLKSQKAANGWISWT